MSQVCVACDKNKKIYDKIEYLVVLILSKIQNVAIYFLKNY